jgi:hypothetical protein
MTKTSVFRAFSSLSLRVQGNKSLVVLLESQWYKNRIPFGKTDLKMKRRG